MFDLDATGWPHELIETPVLVGVHFVTLRVSGPGERAVSSPNCLHQDGGTHSVYFVHLLRRDNIIGSTNVIASPEYTNQQPDNVPEQHIRARFTLEQPLDSYAVRDAAVSHYVSPVQPDRHTKPGHRSTLLIGLMPFTPPSGSPHATPTAPEATNR